MAIHKPLLRAKSVLADYDEFPKKMNASLNLLVDFGNSRVKWATSQAGQLSNQFSLDNDQLSIATLLAQWHCLPEPEYIGLACVSSPQSLGIAKAAAAVCWPKAKCVVAHAQAEGFGVRNAYLQPEKLGVDRWLALIAARQALQPVCIVDCGTAITLDLLDGQGQHLGGLICPGLSLMKQALSQGTEALAFDSQQFPLQPANFTQAAIDSGSLFAAIGLIEATLARQHNHFQLILTGGDAQRIGDKLSLGYTIDKDLVLRGLALLVVKLTLTR